MYKNSKVPVPGITVDTRLAQVEEELCHLSDKVAELIDGVAGLYGAIRRFTGKNVGNRRHQTGDK